MSRSTVEVRQQPLARRHADDPTAAGATDIARTTPLHAAAVACALGVLVAMAAPAAADPFPACPAGAKEFALFVGARTDTTPCDCNTIISCANLDKRDAATTVEFFNGLTGTLRGDASLDIPPGQIRSFGMDSRAVLGIRNAHVSAGIGGIVQSTARVCSTSKKLACTGIVECHCKDPWVDPGPVVVPLEAILKKQKGA